MIFQESDKASEIAQKMQEAPDSGYEIGVFIGSYLPFFLFAVVAFILFRKLRKKS